MKVVQGHLDEEYGATQLSCLFNQNLELQKQVSCHFEEDVVRK